LEHLEKRQKVTIMIAIMAAMFFAAVNMTIVGTSLPKIISKIGGMAYFEWVFTIYMLTSTITAMLVGKLSDIYGRKNFILIGIGVFTVGAFFSGTSDNIYQLIIYRGIQGFGGGMIMSSAFATIGDLFSPRERGRWQGTMAGVFGLSSLFGPTLGGYIVDNFHWQWVFWVFLPVGIFAFILILRLYPAQEKKQGEKIDYLGAVVLTVMIVTLLLGFSWAGKNYAWTSLEIIGLFLASAIALITFIFIENRVKSPVMPLYLFKNNVFTLSNVAGFLMGMGMFGVIMYTPFFVQGVLGYSATTSGIVEMIMTIAMVSASTISGQLITRTGKYKVLALTGLTIMSAGLFTNSLLTTDSSLSRVIIQLIIIGIGLGTIMPVFQVTVQNAVRHKYLGVATSAMQVFRQLGGTIGVAVMGTIMANLMKNQMSNSDVAMPEGDDNVGGSLEQLQDPQILMDSDQLDAMRAEIPDQMVSMFDQLITAMREALSYSVTSVFLFSSIVVAAAVVVTAFLKEIPLRTTNEDEEDQDQLKAQKLSLQPEKGR
jgi:EmrB/QacA subfamily drug resistance transporter